MKLYQQQCIFEALNHYSTYAVNGKKNSNDPLEGLRWADVECIGEAMAEIFLDQGMFNAMPSYRQVSNYLGKLQNAGILRAKFFKGSVWNTTNQDFWWVRPSYDEHESRIRKIYTPVNEDARIYIKQRAENFSLV